MAMSRTEEDAPTLPDDSSDSTEAQRTSPRAPTPAPSLLRPRPADRYERGEEIARGGMGRILSAADKELGRNIAIKELLTSSPHLERRFEREIHITAKLQHPAIIAVHEAGRWPSGKPFYTMKHVEGRALDRVIDSGKTLADRLRLLPHVLAVADALAYAHSQRVIHRDLKPANVLVGEFGETVVIDWGLAKEIGGADDEESLSDPSLSDDDGLTSYGEAIGTPAYMPPEQARGEPVDARADVYALGAMLYHLLAGRMPYADTKPRGAAELLASVKRGPPTAIAQLAPTAPADLVAVVDKAMARAPTDRYPTANELAADLRRFSTGQLVGAHQYTAWQLARRWLGRHRAVVSVAAAMALALAALGVVSFVRITRERDRAERQHAEAERSRTEVEGLLDFMLGDLRDKLAPIGKVDLLDLVATRASTYFAERPVDWARPETARNRAAAHENLGDVRGAQGNLDAALAEYRASEEILARLSETHPNRTDWQFELASSRSKQGDTLRAKGDLPAAMQLYRSARSLRAQLAERSPGNPEWQAALGQSHSETGDVLLEQGDLDEALSEYRATEAIYERLADARPEVSDRRANLSSIRLRIGEALLYRGDPEAALEAYRSSASLLEELTRADPENTRLLRNLSVAYDRIGNALEATGDRDGALAEYEAGKQIAERLARQDPSNSTWQRDLSVSHNKVGDAYAARSDPKRALREFRSAEEIRERLAEMDPDNARWQRDLSVSHDNLGKVLAQMGDHRASLQEFRASMRIAARLADLAPDNAEWQFDLSVSHLNVGAALAATGARADARAEYQSAERILERLVQMDPANATWQETLADCRAERERVAEGTADRPPPVKPR